MSDAWRDDELTAELAAERGLAGPDPARREAILGGVLAAVTVPAAATAGVWGAGKIALWVVLGGTVGVGSWVATRAPTPDPVQAPVVQTPIHRAPSAPTSAPPPDMRPPAVDAGLADAAPVAAASAPRRPKPTRRAPATGAGLDAERALLDRARATLVSRPKESLSLLRTHRRTWPRGALREEAAFLRVHALHTLGRDARGAATHFRRRYPNSPLIPNLPPD